MGKTHSFKFQDHDLNERFLRLLDKAAVDHSIDEDGLVHYSADDEALVENDLVSSVRAGVFPSWQILTCPRDCRGRYRAYMSRHHIPFREEWSNGELWFLIPRRHRPHSWKLDGSDQGQPLARQRSK